MMQCITKADLPTGTTYKTVSEDFSGVFNDSSVDSINNEL